VSVAVCEYVTWPLMLKKECRLREFKKQDAQEGVWDREGGSGLMPHC